MIQNDCIPFLNCAHLHKEKQCLSSSYFIAEAASDQTVGFREEWTELQRQTREPGWTPLVKGTFRLENKNLSTDKGSGLSDLQWCLFQQHSVGQAQSG